MPKLYVACLRYTNSLDIINMEGVHYMFTGQPNVLNPMTAVLPKTGVTITHMYTHIPVINGRPPPQESINYMLITNQHSDTADGVNGNDHTDLFGVLFLKRQTTRNMQLG